MQLSGHLLTMQAAILRRSWRHYWKVTTSFSVWIENLTYDYLHSSEDNLWSLLYLTGYLTRARENHVGEELPEGMVALVIPNKEVREIFETTIIKWFADSARSWNREALFQAVWSGDSESITKEMNALLRRTISYHDYKEDFYHAFLAGIFTGAGYMVDSNKEHGEGRSDVVVYDSVHGRVAIFEAKYTKVLAGLEKECDAALQQIENGCTRKSTKTIMMRSFAMESPSSRSGVW